MPEMRFTLDEELHKRFKLMCVENHVHMVKVVRELIEDWIDQEERAAQLEGKK